MISEPFLDALSAFASIATAGVALVAYFRFLWDRRVKRLRLEAFLKPEIQHDIKFGPLPKPYPVIAVMAALKMTEAEVIDAAFRSCVVKCTNSPVEQPKPAVLYLQYDSNCRQ
jgi:hypothetical protein